MSAEFILNKKFVQSTLELKDPFIFAVHHYDVFPAGNEKMEPVHIDRNIDWGRDFNPQASYRMYHGEKIPGFPAHPHSGFETITIVEQGFADHFDSKGSSGRYGHGDVQWLTTGKGVQHSEMFPLLSMEHENILELFQIWFNLPGEDKKAEPSYKMLWNEEIPVYQGLDAAGNKYRVKIISGEFEGVKSLQATPDSWASRPDSLVNIWIMTLDPHARLDLSSSREEVARFFYLYKGSELTINDVQIKTRELLELDPAVPLQIINGEQQSYILWLEGKPINEEIVQHGPFVASSHSELRNELESYRKDEFGGWQWGKADPVFSREQGRVASYDFGKRLEYPPNKTTDEQ